MSQLNRIEHCFCCGQVFSIEGSAPSVASPVTPDLLKHFAFEAESQGNYELAERYYKEVLQHVMWHCVCVTETILCVCVGVSPACEQAGPLQ